MKLPGGARKLEPALFCLWAVCSFLLVLVFIITGSVSIADSPGRSTAPTPDPSKAARNDPAVAPTSLQLIVKTNKSKYASEEPVELTITFLNTGKSPVDIMLPMGADASGIFKYELVEMETKAKWTACQCSLRSFAADARHSIAPGATQRYTESSLSYQNVETGPAEHDSGTRLSSLGLLPPGHYQLTAIYDGQRTFYPKNRLPILLKSEHVNFSVEAK
jgi:hypothetical protein